MYKPKRRAKLQEAFLTLDNTRAWVARAWSHQVARPLLCIKRSVHKTPIGFKGFGWASAEDSIGLVGNMLAKFIFHVDGTSYVIRIYYMHIMYIIC